MKSLLRQVNDSASTFTPARGNVWSSSSSLKVSQPHEPAEHEARRMADEAMRMPVTPGAERATPPPHSAAGAGGDAQSSLAGGQPLSQPVRNFFEPRLNFDFSRVRIHSDERAAELAETYQARAFTLGNDVVFNAREYAPETETGKRLIAHELAHVVQHNDGSQTPLPVIHRDPLPAPRAPDGRPLRGGWGMLPPHGTYLWPPLDPLASTRLIQQMLDQQRAPVLSWLNQNTAGLMLLSANGIVCRVRRAVPQAARLADVEIESVAREWAASIRHVIPRFSSIPERCDAGIPQPSPAGPSLADSDIIAATRRAFSAATDGIGVERPHGRAVVSVRGATVGLRRGQFEASGTLGWTGSMGVETSYGDLHFSGSISQDRWDLSLSFPSDSGAPMLDQLTQIFTRGETAMRGILSATQNFRNLDDVSAVSAAISPHVQPVKEAVEAAQAIAAVRPGVNFGISASGPTFSQQGTPSRPDAISILATITIRF